jgi:hypothetical protein
MKLYHFTKISQFFDSEGSHEWVADLKPSSQDDWRDRLGFIPEPMVCLVNERAPYRPTGSSPPRIWAFCNGRNVASIRARRATAGPFS